MISFGHITKVIIPTSRKGAFEQSIIFLYEGNIIYMGDMRRSWTT